MKYSNGAMHSRAIVHQSVWVATAEASSRFNVRRFDCSGMCALCVSRKAESEKNLRFHTYEIYK